MVLYAVINNIRTAKGVYIFMNKSFDFTVTDEILHRHNCEERAIISILQEIQEYYHYLPNELFPYISEKTGLSEAKIYSVATFYENFSLEPKGKYIIKICDGTACHIRSSQLLADEIEKLLGIRPGETSQDGEFTLETVNCLGSCAIAPVMVMNDIYYGKVTPVKLRDIISKCGGNNNE